MRQKKNLVPTITGIELIKTINNELLKSVELTGLWEKKLRLIEKGEYVAQDFITEMKQMVSDLVKEVIKENVATITIPEEVVKKAASEEKENKPAPSSKENKAEEHLTCPKCKKGVIVKGKTAYGCNAFKEGCDFKVLPEQFGRILTYKQIQALVSKGKTPKIKDFTKGDTKVNGNLILRSDFSIDLQVEKAKEPAVTKPEPESKVLTCPLCKTGTLIKGNKAWGCNRFKEGCRFVVPFDVLLQKFNTRELTVEILAKI